MLDLVGISGISRPTEHPAALLAASGSTRFGREDPRRSARRSLALADRGRRDDPPGGPGRSEGCAALAGARPEAPPTAAAEAPAGSPSYEGTFGAAARVLFGLRGNEFDAEAVAFHLGAVPVVVLDDVSLYELRRSYASTMVRAGAPLIVVARALGHAVPRMVDEHCAHLAPSCVADVIRSTAPDLSIAAG